MAVRKLLTRPGRPAGMAGLGIILAAVLVGGPLAGIASAQTISATAGDGQHNAVDTSFGTALVVQVVDGSSAPIQGDSVTFAVQAGGSGASASFPASQSQDTETTDVNGNATAATLTSNSTAGTFTVQATDTTQSPNIFTTFTLTNDPGPAATVVIDQGSPQSAAVGTDYSIDFKVTVTDGPGNVISGDHVTFQSPGSHRGLFGGSTFATVITGADGTATAPTFTAGDFASTFTVTATEANQGNHADFTLTNTAGMPATMVPHGGNNQSTAVDTDYSPFSVLVTDGVGNVVPNDSVTFTAPGSGASGTFPGSSLTATVSTDSNGIATSPVLSANSMAGAFQVSATDGTASTNISLTNDPGPAATVVMTAGNNQSEPINTAFAVQLAVTVTDGPGNVISGDNVVFHSSSVSHGSFGGNANATVSTNGSGLAQAPVLTSGTAGGAFQVTATEQNNGNSFTFDLTTTAGNPAGMAIVAGDAQSEAVDTNYPIKLAVTVTDGGGNPVPGDSVTFTAPASGATGSFAGSSTDMVSTDPSGTAQAGTLKASSTAGAFSVTATDGTFSVTFHLTNVPGPPAAVLVTAGDAQQVGAGSQFSIRLAATVIDGPGNVIPGVNVKFVSPGAGHGTFPGGVLTATVATDASGIAQAPILTAGGTVGAFNVSATEQINNNAASFGLTVTPGSPHTASATSGSGQSTPVNQPFGHALGVHVTDIDGNAVPGVTVTFAASSGANGQSAIFANNGQATTNGSGNATAPSMTANSRAGSYTVTATVAGASPAVFNATNTPVVPFALSATQLGASSTGDLVTVAWGTPDYDGGSPITSYTITLLPSQGHITGLTGHFFEFRSLTNGAALSIEVTAVNAAGSSPPSPAVQVVPVTQGYWMAAADGGIFNFGAAAFYGSTGAIHLNRPIVGMAVAPLGDAYWLVASDGGIFTFPSRGDAGYYGSTGGMHLNQPIVGMAATPTGHGYWLVASDGGIFAFGDARFYGSTGGMHLNKPIVGMAPTVTGRGYWLVASDGGIFAFGDARFFGSTGAIHLNQPIVSMTPTASGNGYWLVASDGGIFSFGDARFFGSTGAIHLNRPIVGMSVSSTGNGYWLVASDGGIFSFGDAPFYGSTGAMHLNQPIVALGTQPITHFG